MNNENDKIELLMKVFENQQSLISSADSKANIALSIQTFIISTVLGTAIIINASIKIAEFSCFMKSIYYPLFAGFLITSIVGISFCIQVFKPRPPQEDKEIKRMGITYFGHIEKYKNSDEYLEKINGIKSNDVVEEFAFQNYTLARILAHKMSFVKYSTNLLFVNIILGISLLIFSLVIK